MIAEAQEYDRPAFTYSNHVALSCYIWNHADVASQKGKLQRMKKTINEKLRVLYSNIEKSIYGEEEYEEEVKKYHKNKSVLAADVESEDGEKEETEAAAVEENVSNQGETDERQRLLLERAEHTSQGSQGNNEDDITMSFQDIIRDKYPQHSNEIKFWQGIVRT